VITTACPDVPFSPSPPSARATARLFLLAMIYLLEFVGQASNNALGFFPPPQRFPSPLPIDTLGLGFFFPLPDLVRGFAPSRPRAVSDGSPLLGPPPGGRFVPISIFLRILTRLLLPLIPTSTYWGNVFRSSQVTARFFPFSGNWNLFLLFARLDFPLSARKYAPRKLACCLSTHR